MKKRLTTALATLLALTTVQAQQQMELTAEQVAQQMAPGWNLGNTMEAGNNAYNFKNSGLGTETYWQGTKTTQQVIDYVKSLGFRSVRIPCAWVMGHIVDAQANTIDPQWLARVKEIVDYCINDGLYVVINQHWDGGWLENNIADATKMAQNKQVLTQIWTQIAEYFKDYDEHLLFAGLNEPNAGTQSATFNLLEYEQTFIDLVRASGGNNERRVLIVQGPSTNIDHTCNFMAGRMPNDPTPQRLMVEVHYYDPWQWWGMMQDESWGNMFYYWGAENHVSGSKHNATHGEEAYMEEQLEKMVVNFSSQGIPVYIGEFGANRRNITGAGESQEKHNASIKHHYKTFMQKAFAKGLVPVVWDTNGLTMPSMDIINRQTLTIWDSYMMDGIHEAMQEAGIPTTDIRAAMSDKGRDEAIYDLHGRRLTDIPSHGIYIQNGMKLVK